MSVHLSHAVVETVRREGRKSYPHECCGFLIGRIEDGDARRIARVEPVENAREDEAKHNRYLIAPERFMAVERNARKDGLDVLGFFHSHPDAPARPSAFDVEQAWPWYIYVIVSIEQGEPADMTAWTLQDDRSQFDEVEMKIED